MQSLKILEFSAWPLVSKPYASSIMEVFMGSPDQLKLSIHMPFGGSVTTV